LAAPRSDIVDGGGLEVLTSALTRHPAAALVLLSALDVLTRLTESPALDRAFLGSGALGAVISLLHAAASLKPQVSASASFLLANVTSGSADASRTAALDAMRAHLLNGGGLVALISAIAVHKGNAHVAQAGCAALGNLAVGAHAAAALPAMPTIVAAMQSHAGHARIAWLGCIALGNAAVCDDAARWRLVVDAGGIAAVLSALSQHASDAAVVEECLLALDNITSSGDCDTRPAVAAGGGLRAVMRAMTRHPSDVGIAHQGCGVLYNLALDAALKEALVQAGGVGALVGAVDSFGRFAGVAGRACWALALAAGAGGACRQAVIEGGGERVAQAALSAHPGEEGVVEAAEELREKMAAT